MKLDTSLAEPFLNVETVPALSSSCPFPGWWGFLSPSPCYSTLFLTSSWSVYPTLPSLLATFAEVFLLAFLGFFPLAPLGLHPPSSSSQDLLGGF